MARQQKDRMYRKTVTRPLPKGATLVTKKGQKLARWMTSSGEIRECPVNASGKIVEQTGTWYASYLGSKGVIVEVSLETADEKQAQRRFMDLTRKSALIKSGDLTQEDLRKAETREILLEELIEAYQDWQRGNNRAPNHIRDCAFKIRFLFREAGWKVVGDLNRREMVKIVTSLRGRKGERWRQCACNSLSTFGNYLVDEAEVLDENPFRGMYRNKLEDRRRQRRALTEDEISRLLAVAQERCPVRADAYRIYLMTGMRLSELRTLKVEDVHIDLAITPHIKLKGRNEKNRKGSTIPLEPEVVEILRKYMAGKTPEDLVIHVPHDLRKRLLGDLEAAKISSCRIVEENGIKRRYDVVDVHSLRVTFCTLLAKAKVPLTVAQKRMRHSTPSLTANVYTILTDADLIQPEYRIGANLGNRQTGQKQKAE